MTPWEILTQIKATLATVPNVASCKVGLEANITPSDYPLIRIVLTRMRADDPDTARAVLEITVYFGAALLESADGLEAVYEELLAMEEAIREAVSFTVVRSALQAGAFVKATYLDTLTDEDRLPHYKMMASRFEVVG